MDIWDDTLFMVVLFLFAHYGTVSGRQKLVDEAVRQLLLHARYLNGPENRPVVSRQPACSITA
ncbi:MAG: glycoside hydrolase family 88 protein [Symbiopectobacterium sp.]